MRSRRQINPACPISNGWCRGCMAVALLASTTGCSSRPARVNAVDIDIPGVCAALVEEHDADGDGLLSEAELAGAPPLDKRLRQMDPDNDGRVSQEELESHFREVFNPDVGMISAACRVTNNGRPLSGATIHLIPADYLKVDEKAMPIASGVTSTKGVAQMEIHPDYLPPDVPKVRGLVRPGFYLVEVVLPGGKVPERYSTNPTVGVEISPQTTIGGPVHIPLEF